MTARPMRPKSPLGMIRAGPPTLMPARRALQSAHNAHQHNFHLAKAIQCSYKEEAIEGREYNFS